MFRLLESGPTKQQLWELPTSRPEFGNSQFGVRGLVITAKTGLIRQVEENLELRVIHRRRMYLSLMKMPCPWRISEGQQSTIEYSGKLLFGKGE